MKEARLEIRIEKKDKKQLEKVAKESNRTVSNYLETLIKQAIENKTKI